MALLALRKKRSQEKMLHETETKIDTVEGWVNSLESAQRDKQVTKPSPQRSSDHSETRHFDAELLLCMALRYSTR
jgi:hypothetical protein